MKKSERIVEALLSEDDHVSTGPARAALEKAAWAKKHPDYKHAGADGVKKMLYLNPKTGATELWPISQIPDAGLK